MPKLPDPGLDASAFKNYKISFTAIIKGCAYVAAPSKKDAERVWCDEDNNAFDEIEALKKYKINKVEVV